MRNGFLGSLMILIASGGLVLADEPRAPTYASAAYASAPEAIHLQPAPSEDCAAPCGRSCCFGRGRFWGSAEFLLWWIEDGNAPPLATTGPSGGVLGAPGTTTLFGGDLGYDERPGARFTIGSWLDCDCTKGLELSYFFLDGDANRFGTSSTSAVLSRPFFNVITGLPDVQVIAFPGVASGGIRTSSDSSLQGADLNMLCNLCCRPACCPTDCCATECSRRAGFRLDVLAGPRWMQLNEDLIITEQLTDTATGTSFTVVDRFETRNNFYGGQIGARAEWQRGRCFVSLLGKVALGTTQQTVRISGTTVFAEPGAEPVVQQGGLLALPTNIGSYSRNTFSVIPELGVNVGCQVTDRLRAFAGYTFMYWSNVVRPGDQIDVGINPTQLPSAAGPGTLVGPARPAFAFRDTDFWAQGVSVGVEFRW